METSITETSQNREREIEFWDTKSKKQRKWIEETSPEEIKAKIFSANDHWWEPIMGKLTGKNILDIGCGDTYFVAYWDLTGNTARGSDFSPATVETNDMLHKKLGLPQDFYITSSEKIEGLDNSLDLIHMRWVIHHIPPELQDSSFKEMWRVLKPGGNVIAFETNYYYPFRWLVQTRVFEKVNFLRTYALKRGWLDPEERALPNKHYIDLFERNGFKIAKTAYDFTFFAYPAWLFTRSKKFEAFARKVDNAIAFIIPSFFSKDIKIIGEKV